MDLTQFLDRKRQLEVEIASDAEQRVTRFEAETGCHVERIFATPVVDAPIGQYPIRLMTCTVEIRL